MKRTLDYKITYYTGSKLNSYKYINLEFAEDKDIYVRFEDSKLAPSLSFTYYLSFFYFSTLILLYSISILEFSKGGYVTLYMTVTTVTVIITISCSI